MTNHSVINVITVFAICSCFLWAQEKPTLAVLGLERHNVADLDTRLLTNYIRDYFVNSGRYHLLDRENMDNVLREQSWPGYGVTDERAAEAGRLLNVRKIAVGTLMNLDGEFYLEMRIIDVTTSSIDRSRTEKFVGIGEFPFVARHIVEKLCDVSIAVEPAGDDPSQAATASPSVDEQVYYGLKAQQSQSSSSYQDEVKEARVFRMIGFNAGDYKRYRISGLSVEQWACNEARSPLAAGALGALPLGSGFFYIRRYGPAIFISLVKVAAILAMIPSDSRGQEASSNRIIFPVAFAAATGFDIVGSVIAARAYNRKLEKLESLSKAGNSGLDNQAQ